jgi:hypothetical protein
VIGAGRLLLRGSDDSQAHKLAADAHPPRAKAGDERLRYVTLSSPRDLTTSPCITTAQRSAAYPGHVKE